MEVAGPHGRLREPVRLAGRVDLVSDPLGGAEVGDEHPPVEREQRLVEVVALPGGAPDLHGPGRSRGAVGERHADHRRRSMMYASSLNHTLPYRWMTARVASTYAPDARASDRRASSIWAT